MSRPLETPARQLTSQPLCRRVAGVLPDRLSAEAAYRVWKIGAAGMSTSGVYLGTGQWVSPGSEWA
jgi:hypothetical protein